MNKLRARHTTGLLFASFFLWILPPALVLAQDDQAMRNGAEAMRGGNLAAAEKWFQAAVNSSPDDPMANMQLGVAELRLGKPNEAVKSLKSAIARQPVMVGANLFLGIAFTQMHQLDEAAQALQHEIENDPKNAQAEMWLGVVEMQAGHPELATEPLDRASELAPNDLNILEYRGKAHSDVAFASYACMASIDPNSWHVHKVQAQMYVEQKQYKDAISEYQEAIKQAPNNSDLYEELGNTYRKAAQLELAQGAFKKELELSPNNPIAIFNLAKIDIETNEPQTGLDLLNKVIPHYVNVPALYFYLGLGQFSVGDVKSAVVALEKARSLHPESELAPRVEYELSRVYRKLGRIAESQQAIAEYTRLKALNQKHNPALSPADAPTSASPQNKN